MLHFYTEKNRSGRVIEIQDNAAKTGKEGAVYSVPHMRDKNGLPVCAKVFIKAQDQSESSWRETIAKKQEKIEYMAQNQPVLGIHQSSGRVPGYAVFAWPFQCLYEADGTFRGYLMPKCENVISLNTLVKPFTRRKYRVDLSNWSEKFRIAYNLCAIFNYMHVHDIYGIDGNPDNFLFHTTNHLFTLIDTDSFQLRTNDGRVFENNLGFPEIMPPEYQGGKQPDREGDCYILANYLFMLFMDNLKPFVGTITPAGRRAGLDEEDLNQKASIQGCFAYASNPYLQAPPQYLREYENNIPLELQRLFYRSFVGRQNRTTPREWMLTLDAVMKREAVNGPAKRIVAVGNKQTPQVLYPMLLLMDVTPSLTLYQSELIKGFQTMIRELQNHSEAEAIELSLLEFAEKVDREYDFAPVSTYNANDTYGLETLRGYHTSVDTAVNTALQRIRERKRYYVRNALAYKKPKLVLMTDAVFYTSYERRCFEAYMAKNPALSQAEIICIAIGKPQKLEEQQYQASVLTRLASNHSFIRLNHPEEDLKSVFQWISSSINI